ncbi:monovalent cation/H(+) antiporter subunit G [Paenibacillus sp. SYP-B4298]|uniref:monovalent cation/H(+) antiporter subunit G n=1 Tax=Paenibacillus sp. SYP-B4298 TaxID=2996034 RepID=UPI003FA73F06
MSGTVIIEVLVASMVLLGTVLSLLSALGFIRLPDIYTRSHAATKSITLGILFILLGTFIYFLFTHRVVSIRLLLGIVFVFLTAPVAGHLIARSAYRSGVKMWDKSAKDELRSDLKKLNQLEQYHSGEQSYNRESSYP